MTDEVKLAAYRFGADTTDAGRNLTDLQRILIGLNKTSFKDLDLSLTGITKSFASFLPAISITSVAAFTKNSIDAALAVGDMAERAGVAASSFSRLDFAAKQSGVSTSALESGLRNFQNTLSEAGRGSESAVQAFAAIGLHTRDLKALKPEDQLAAIADKFQRITDPADRTRIAIDLFGKSGTELIPILMKGADGIRELTDAAVALDDRAVKGLDRSSKALDKFWDSLSRGTANAIGGVVADIFGSGDELLDLEAKVKDFIELRRLIVANTDLNLAPGARATVELYDKQIEQLNVQIEKLKTIRDIQDAAKNPRFASNHGRVTIDPLSEVSVPLHKTDFEEVPGSPGVKRGTLHDPFKELHDEEKEEAFVERQKRIDKELKDTQKQNERELTEWMQEENKRRLEGIIDLADHTIVVQNDVSDILNRISLGRANFEINLDDLVGQTKLQTAANFVGALLAFNKKHAKAEKALAVAQTVWETGRAIMKAAPNPALMAAAAAAGAINLAKINATNYSESGSGGAGIGFTSSDFSQSGSSMSGQQTDASNNQRGTINVYLDGMVGTQEFVPYFVEKLKDLIDNRDVHIIGDNSSQARALRVAA